MRVNLYLARAIEAYPYELERAVEALNYALSYEPENVRALCLMARVQSEQFGDYESAREYYQSAMVAGIEMPDVYPDYIRFLINYEDYDEAQKLIDFAMQIKGIDKAGILLNQAQLYEALQAFEKAEDALKEAKMYALNNEFISYVDEVLSRVTKKREIVNNKIQQKEKEHEKANSKSNKNWLLNQLNSLL